jgi:endonuclease/exonuclease/phosphatase family metal-dependent hydrolase
MTERHHLKLLTYNIQVGIETSHYGHYLTRAWRYALPFRSRHENLNRIAHILRPYDLVALQETDAGSLRSDYVDQVAYLANQADFPYWHTRVNRRLGRWARHSMGLLSRYRPTDVREVSLPSRIPGRGALIARFGEEADGLLVVVAHLSLDRRSQANQLEFLGSLIGDKSHAILMGDLNCSWDSLRTHAALNGLRGGPHPLPSYPSWRPTRSLDHILVTPGLDIQHTQVVSHVTSDHLPLAMHVTLPHGLRLTEDPLG